ncbi:hypothetical protein Tco_0778175 [Tanacetum coccineum]
MGAKNKVRAESPKIEAKSKREPKVETKGKPRTKSKAEANELRFDNGWIKAINGDAKAISDVAQGVKTKIGGWEGEWRSSVHGGNGKRHKEWSQDDVRNVARERLQRVEAKYKQCIKILKNSMEGGEGLENPWKVLEVLETLYASTHGRL